MYGEVIADCTHVQAIRRSQSRVAQGASSPNVSPVAYWMSL
jgi:hypothetical protein